MCIFYVFFFLLTQEINARRSKDQSVDKDPLVWTNHQVIKWVQGIDLEVGSTTSLLGSNI